MPVRKTIERRFLIARFLLAGSGRYAWSALKSCVKILIGRRPYFSDHDLFFQQYVLHILGLRRIRMITCPGLRGEGAASQALMVMRAINFARSSGLTYVHTPFSSIAHADRPMQEWVAAWESTFNFGAGELVCDYKRHQVVNYCYNFRDLELCFGWRHRMSDLTDCFKALLPEFRHKYHLNKPPWARDKVTIAVHIRRGDAAAHDHYLFTSAHMVLKTLTQVKSILDAHRIEHRIHVYSEGIHADFSAFSCLDTTLFPDLDAIRTLEALIESDILIMAKGLFSYYAALISGGIRIFEPYGPPMDDWLVRGEDGSFDNAAFELQLTRLLDARAVVC
jgi:hypothetical protein